MGCFSPQLCFSVLGSHCEIPCGICQGCRKAQAQTNRERQRAWFDRVKRRFHNG